MKRIALTAAMLGISALSLSGCGGHQQPAAPMAPPMSTSNMAAPPMNGGGMGGNMNGNPNGNMNGSNVPAGMAPQGAGGVYNWQDVPANQQVGITRAQFDQGGYQLITDTGDTIIVPFANQNLYVMRFGRSNGQTYFVNEGNAPTLYLAQGFGLANAASQGGQAAMWYPLPTNFNYERPVYVGIAPSWNDYTTMGWYPGMSVYGGMYGYNPYHPIWMPGFYMNIGGSPYYGWGGYHSYYTSHTGYYRTSYVNRSYYNTAPRGAGSYRYSGSTGSYRPGSTGSYRPGSTGSYRPSGGTGSFGTGGRPSSGFGNGGFNGSRPSGGFGSGGGSTTMPSTRGSFGNGGSSTTMPSTRGGSFGGGGGGFSSTPRPSGGSSFGGGGRSSGGSFGGGGRRR